MRIRCSTCGSFVSSEVPDTTVLRAYIECVNCIEEETLEIKYNREFRKEQCGQAM